MLCELCDRPLASQGILLFEADYHILKRTLYICTVCLLKLFFPEADPSPSSSMVRPPINSQRDIIERGI